MPNPVKHWKDLPIALKALLFFSVLTVFSSPMPQHIGWLEITIGLGLLAGTCLLVKPIYGLTSESTFLKYCLVLLTILLAVPMTIAVIHHNPWNDIARDFFPSAFFLCLPILFYVGASLGKNIAVCDVIAASLLLIGVSEVCGFYLGLHDLLGNPTNIAKMMANGLQMVVMPPIDLSSEYAAGSSLSAQEEIQYQRSMAEAMIKLYDPATYFAAIAISCAGMAFMLQSWRGWLCGVLLFFAGSGIFYGFLLLALRANVVLYLITIFIYAASLVKRPGFYLRLLPSLVVIAIAAAPWMLEGISLLLLKQQAVATNGKTGEWVAVFKQIHTSSESLLLGMGWGGTFHNPIVDQPTRFTHSLVSYYLLKTGVLGFICFFIYLLVLTRFIVTSSEMNNSGFRYIYLLSTIPPLVVGLLFQPSYKILSYALVFTLFVFSIGVRKER